MEGRNTIQFGLIFVMSGQCSTCLRTPELTFQRVLGWLDFIIKDFLLMLILKIAGQMLNDSLCCSYQYKRCLCRFLDKRLDRFSTVPNTFVCNMYNFIFLISFL